MYIADLHIHSRYYRATSPGADAGDPGAFCQAKGIRLLGTGDFTILPGGLS